MVGVAGLLQDLGYTLEDSEVKLGVLTGSKEADATNTTQAILVGLNVAFGGARTPIDVLQKISVSIVTRPKGDSHLVRVTFQRTIWNDFGQVSRREAIDDTEIYQEFFQRLSKALFLEAHDIQ